jgi:ubiquinone/menaquinone biosynthesis C-methylase UbiE
MADSPGTYLHGHHDSVLRSHRWRTVENSAGYLLPLLSPGARLLDVGCGPGTITAGLATRLGDGSVVGIDPVDDIVCAARSDAAHRRLSNLSFEVGDVYHLGFDDGVFDVVHAHQVLQHLSDPVNALTEMRRVCRPGGVVAARDGDYGGMFWWPEVVEMQEWRSLYQGVARAVGGEPDAGRHLHRWARQAGFTDIEVSASSWVFTTPDDRSWWGGLWADRIIQSSLADQAIDRGIATKEDLERMAEAWRRWASSDDGSFVVPHCEIVCRA